MRIERLKESEVKKVSKIDLILACANELSSNTPNMIQLLPYGHVKTKKGDFIVDEAAENEVMQNFSNRKNDVVVDYEHQTLKDVVAPAAGWIKKLENRGKEGIWGEVEWTGKAKDFISNKEYKYLSPVIFVSQSDKRVQLLHSAALTNDPAIDGMVPLANKLIANTNLNDNEEENNNMDELKQIAVALGLDENATLEQIIQAIKDLCGKCEKCEKNQEMSANKDILSLLNLPVTSKVEDIKGKIIELKNPSGYVSVEVFNKLQEKVVIRERDELVLKAMEDGKITPTQKEWAEAYALKDPQGFTNFVKNAPQIVPMYKMEFKSDNNGYKVPDEAQMQVNKMLGVSNEDFQKFNGGNK